LNDYVQALIRKHRANGVLVDTNLIILLLVGRAQKHRIEHHKKTSAYRRRDYELLEQLLIPFETVVTTPHILTEISNQLPELATDLKSWVSQARELFTQSETLVEDVCFLPFGLADAAISAGAAQNLLVLTSDAALCDALQRRGRDAINFNHLRGL
jgi:hypothetical protein